MPHKPTIQGHRTPMDNNGLWTERAWKRKTGLNNRIREDEAIPLYVNIEDSSNVGDARHAISPTGRGVWNVNRRHQELLVKWR